jgi:hypothetical protein
MNFGQTLVAFLVGGAVTLATQLILEALREKRAGRRRAEATETEVKMAARLVVLDLISMLALLRGARETGRWWSALLLPLGAWESYGQALSRELDDEAWRMVGATFAGAAAWNELVRGARRYYWVMPHMNLRRLGLGDMQDALRTGAAEGLRDLLGIALPSATEDDPLRELAERALTEGD